MENTGRNSSSSTSLNAFSRKLILLMMAYSSLNTFLINASFTFMDLEVGFFLRLPFLYFIFQFLEDTLFTISHCVTPQQEALAHTLAQRDTLTLKLQYLWHGSLVLLPNTTSCGLQDPVHRGEHRQKQRPGLTEVSFVIQHIGKL